MAGFPFGAARRCCSSSNLPTLLDWRIYIRRTIIISAAHVPTSRFKWSAPEHHARVRAPHFVPSTTTHSTCTHAFTLPCAHI
jgi:hypothetical protein